MRPKNERPVSSGYFEALDGDAVILRRNGQFTQAPLFRRRKRLFAQVGKTFVGLNATGGTTDTSIKWDEVLTDATYGPDPFGNLELKD